MRLTDSFVLVGVLPALAWLAWRARRDHRGWPWTAVRGALIAYAGLIIGLAFFPFPLPPWDPADAIVQPWILPIPFQTIAMSIGLGWEWPAARFLVGNIVAFLPLGLFVALLLPAGHSWRLALLVGLGVSLAIEIAQVLLSLVIGYPYRQFDVDDLLLNTLGTGLGYGAYRVGRAAIGRRRVPSRP
jgi:glycopeptide antibiotics resistance protein